MDSIDWSFLEMLDKDDVGNFTDFGLFPDLDETYIPPNFAFKDDDNNEDNHGNDDNGGNFSQSSLWNF